MKHPFKTTALCAAMALILTQACTVTEGPIDNEDGGSSVDGPISIDDLGTEDVDGSGSTEITLEVPAGAQSVALVVEGAELGNLVLADLITSPSGQVVYDFNNDISINRTDATDGLYTLLIPSNTDVVLEEGDWLVNLRSGSAFEAQLTQITKTAPATDNLLDLNIYMVGTEGLDAAAAETDEGVQAILANVGAIYQQAGFNVRAISYQDITGGDADTYGVVDSEAELASLFALSPSESNISLNIFCVADIMLSSSGFSTLGQAGGVPGPPILQGTTRSGVAVNMGNYLAAVAAADQTMIDEATSQLEIIIAHETGHFLGLYHTVERNGLALDGGINGQDPLSDTELCDDSADLDGDGVLSIEECAPTNLMFWSPPNDARSLTSSQGKIMVANPLVH